MAANIKPLDDRILIKQCDAEQVTAGGIVLPDSAKEKPHRGKVVATGPGKLLKDGSRGKMETKKGDEVFYGKYAGTEIEIDRQTYVIIRESDILGVVE
jgi:chaperonin GroES